MFKLPNSIICRRIGLRQLVGCRLYCPLYRVNGIFPTQRRALTTAVQSGKTCANIHIYTIVPDSIHQKVVINSPQDLLKRSWLCTSHFRFPLCELSRPFFRMLVPPLKDRHITHSFFIDTYQQRTQRLKFYLRIQFLPIWQREIRYGPQVRLFIFPPCSMVKTRIYRSRIRTNRFDYHAWWRRHYPACFFAL